MRSLYCKHHVKIKQFLIDHCCDATYRSVLEDECRIALIKHLMGNGDIDFDKLSTREACLLVEQRKQHHLDPLSLQGFFNAFDKNTREDSACLCCAVAVEMGHDECTMLFETLNSEEQCMYQQLPGVVKRSRWSRSLSEFLGQNLPLSTASV